MYALSIPADATVEHGHLQSKERLRHFLLLSNLFSAKMRQGYFPEPSLSDDTLRRAFFNVTLLTFFSFRAST